MKITENKLRRIIRSVIRSSENLTSETLVRGARPLASNESPTILNAISTNVREFCSDSMLYDYDSMGNGMLCDMSECQDLIAALYQAEDRGVDIPMLSAKIVQTQFDGRPTIQVDILSPVSEDFFNLFVDIQEDSDAGGAIDMYSEKIYPSTVNDKYKFSVDDNIKIINSTQNVTYH